MMKFLPKLHPSLFLRAFVSSFPILILLIVVTVIGLLNYKTGTVMTGWDNLHPEYNFSANISRSLYAVWQEYQGLGLLGGMGHASDLLRQLFLAFLALFLPSSFLRFFWVMLTLFIGSTGVYILIRSALFEAAHKKRATIALIGALFYLLNLSTIQSYFVPFEAFIAHFAALPWLLFASLLFLKNQSARNTAILSLILLLATPAAYIPTLFVTFLLSLSTILLVLFLTAKGTLRLFKATLKLFGLIFIINSFWLLPFLYFTLTHSTVNLDAKMNQMATETILLQNKEFGNLADVVLLKGFWFNNVDPDLSGNFRFMFGAWRNYYASPLIQAVGLSIFSIIVLGAGSILKNKKPLHLAFLGIFLFAFTMLATNTPPFSWAVELFRNVPLFGQAFRFPFTKFSILTSLSYSVLFSFGVLTLWNILKKAKKLSGVIAIGIALLLIFLSVFPVFNGNLFYEKEQIKLPKEYSQTFEFFKSQDRNTRIANLPQHTFWGWNFYTWGYGGSGFLWYGIEQPILDRAFDVWSSPLENYYFELSRAIYSKDSAAVERVLNKYQVNWILIDKSVYSPFSPKVVFYDTTESLLSNISSVKKVQSFGHIDIYAVSLKDKPSNFLFTTGDLPKSNVFSWNDNDNAYAKLGNYVTTSESADSFVFPSLFTNKLQSDLEFKATVKDQTITFTKLLPETAAPFLELPSFISTENSIPVEIKVSKRQDFTEVLLNIVEPIIKMNGNAVNAQPTVSIPLFIIPQSLDGTFSFNSNGNKEFQIDTRSNSSQYIYASLTQDNIITLLNTSTGEIKTQTITSSLLKNSLQDTHTISIQPEIKAQTLEVTLPYITDSYTGRTISPAAFHRNEKCNAFRNGAVTFTSKIEKADSLLLLSDNNTACVSTHLSTLTHNVGYAISIDAKNIKGQPLHFWTLNPDEGFAPLDTYLTSGNNILILPPMEKYGQGYSFHFENISIGNQIAENQINSFAIAQIPYNYLKGIQTTSKELHNQVQPNVTITSTHPNTALYIIEAKVAKPFTLVLSQSYDSGWNAYALPQTTSHVKNSLYRSFPFLFAKPLPHLKINNWENGWTLQPTTRRAEPLGGAYNLQPIVIIYLPQYLQYAGFLLLWLHTGIFVLLLLRQAELPSSLVRLDRFFHKKAEDIKQRVASLTKRT